MLRIKFLFAWTLIVGLVAAGIYGIADMGAAVAVQNAADGLDEGPQKPISLKIAGKGSPIMTTAGKIVGVRLRNPLGELVGSVKAIATDTFTGKTYALVDYNAPPLGRNKPVIVPLDKVVAQPGEEEYLLNVGRYQLENAPSFDQGNFTNNFSAYWYKKNRVTLVFDRPKQGSAASSGFFDRFQRGLTVIWSWITA